MRILIDFSIIVADNGVGMREADAKSGKTLGVQLIDIFTKQPSIGTRYVMHFQDRENKEGTGNDVRR